MRAHFTPTLGLCLFGALAAGAALTLPPSAPPVTPPAEAEQAQSYPAAANRDRNPEAAPVATVTILDFTYTPPIAVAPGQTVTVVNRDGVAHTVTAGDGAFDSGEVPGGAASAVTAPGEAGSYPFFCRIHPTMTGTLEVRS